MELLIWSNTYSVGIDVIDEQHKTLIHLLNELHTIQQQQGGDEQVEAILDELVKYTVYHFSTEEEMFRKYNYPEYEHHKGIHERLIQDVKKNIDDFKGKNESTSENLMIFLTDWLKDHILGNDKKFGLFMKQQSEEDEDDL